MDNERADTGQTQHDTDQLQGSDAGSGYPEEEPGSSADQHTGGPSTQERSGSTPNEHDDSDAPAGGSGEGSQSTGNPGGAG
jgi:hypothetical protein